jgi:hypothetical protein
MTFGRLSGRAKVLSAMARWTAICAALLIGTSGVAQAQTKVIRDGECAITIIIPIEFYSQEPIFSDTVHKIKNQIERAWNGPTTEMIDHIAARADGIQKSETRTGAPAEYRATDRPKLNQLYRDFMKLMGGNPNCATVNCCQICVIADVRLRMGDDAPKTPGYHQIELKPDKDKDGKWVRSYVRRYQLLGGPQSTSGTGVWNAEDDYWPAWAHESGHLMGLPDHYHDSTDENGNTISIGDEGHANDIMNRNLAWPTENDFKEILKIAGIDITNCCKDPTRYIEVVNRELRTSYTAINSCNPDDINRQIAVLTAQRASIVPDNITLPVKYDLINSIDIQIANLKNALENCQPPRIIEITYQTIKIGIDAVGSCDRDLVQEVMLKLDAERVQIAANRSLGADEKFDALSAIDTMKARLEKALQDCPPKEAFTVYTGFEGGIWCTYGFGIPLPISLVPGDDVPAKVDQPNSSQYDVFRPTTIERMPVPAKADQRRTPLSELFDTNVPDTPKLPPVGDTPNVPSQTPETPKIPTAEKTPDAPKAPGTPKTPDTSKTPDTPKAPDTPPPTTTTEKPAPIPDTIFVKASEAVLQGGQTSTPLGGQNVKLFPPNKPDLPGTGIKTAQDTGFNKDPVECKTGADGSCEMKVDRNDRPYYRLPGRYGRPNNYRMGVDLPRKDGGVAELPKDGPSPGKPELPPGTNAIDDTFKIGDRTFMRLAFTFPYGPNIDFHPLYTPFLKGYETDYCRDKQPGPPLDAQPEPPRAIDNGLPSGTVKLHRAASRARGR